jgi:hypothetical protein
MSGIDKNRRDKRGYADPDYKIHHEHGYVTLCRMRLAIPDDCCNQVSSQAYVLHSPASWALAVIAFGVGFFLFRDG